MQPVQSFVTIDGVRLALRRSGAGRPLVCLHAIAHGAADFDALAGRIGGSFEVIAVDWPGHGASAPDRQPPSAQRYGDLLTGLLDALGLQDPVLLGNSIGGAAAIAAAARRPVAGLVLCDSGGLVAVDATVQRFCRLFRDFFAAGARGAAWFPAAYALYYRLLVLPRPAAAGRRREIVAQGRAMAPLLEQAWTAFGRPDADLRAVAAGLDIPVWAAWAAQDRVIPLSRCLPAIQAMKRAAVTRFRAGHSAFLEQPDAFAEGFRRWAAALPAPRLAAA